MDIFEKAVSGYHIQKDLEFYKSFGNYVRGEENRVLWEFFNKRENRVSPKDISYRTMTHWDNQGILPKNCRKEGQKWRFFSVMDLVWLSIVKELRAFDIGLEQIKKAKKCLNSAYNDCEYGELEYCSAQSFFFKRPCDVLFFQDGRAEVSLCSEIEETKDLMGIPSHIRISLNGILQGLFQDKDLKPVNDYTIPLDKGEAKLIELISSGEFKSVTAKVLKGEINTIESVEQLDVDVNISHRKMVASNQDVKMKYRDGKTQYAESTKYYKP